MTPLLRKILADQPGCFVDPREQGECYFCGGQLGQESETTRLFAVAADGGMLLRLPEDTRKSTIERGVAEPNNVLPRWVLHAPPGTKHQADALHPEHNGMHDPAIHGDPEDWVWMPIPDSATFDRRRPHILETLSYCQYSLQKDDYGSKRNR